MTYSIIVTICFIILLILFVRATTRLAVCENALDETVKRHKDYADGIKITERHVSADMESMRKHINWLESKLNDEKDRVMDLSGRIATQRDRLKHLRKALKDAQNELLMVSDLMHIKFTAVLPDGSHTKTLFKLGLGPCGLHVKSLRWTELEDRYLIDQLCTNGERKQFVYYKSEVVGRIEFRHGSAH